MIVRTEGQGFERQRYADRHTNKLAVQTFRPTGGELWLRILPKG